ncbi:hypothetical protein [Microbispora sp. H10949]|uniref:hypothetical protein n=1 Tax=Microbispora sp. H10949 TaxID=2729111 RepID=UPI0016003EA3|nr:hypothetical protein [Microbispora sp. H10949]
MKYAMKASLSVRGDIDDLGEIVDAIADELADLQDCDDKLLDFAYGSDATGNTVQFELTVECDSVDETVTIGGSWLRTAIHATGGYTPGWEDSGPRQHAIVYEIDEAGVHVRPLERV